VWPDSYQERNALIPQQYELNNRGDSWQSLPCVFCEKDCMTQSTLLSEKLKGNLSAHA